MATPFDLSTLSNQSEWIGDVLNAYGQGGNWGGGSSAMPTGNFPIRPDWYSLYARETAPLQMDLLGASQLESPSTVWR